ncbi:hypothetical protein DL98DRAFT_516141 [Cadophora sp. DSE1049]|nr:hypothetical protein DL98DRAFT_516141 [Cadophora sp. DSE1049]
MTGSDHRPNQQKYTLDSWHWSYTTPLSFLVVSDDISLSCLALAPKPLHRGLPAVLHKFISSRCFGPQPMNESSVLLAVLSSTLLTSPLPTASPLSRCTTTTSDFMNPPTYSNRSEWQFRIVPHTKRADSGCRDTNILRTYLEEGYRIGMKPSSKGQQWSMAPVDGNDVVVDWTLGRARYEGYKIVMEEVTRWWSWDAAGRGRSKGSGDPTVPGCWSVQQAEA